MIYMNVSHSDLVSNNVLTKEQVEWASNVRIPYTSTNGEWPELQRIQTSVTKAIASGVVKEVEREVVQIQRGPQVISDYIAGPGGAVQSQADGKMYDSKSQYYKAVRAAGCEVMGTDAPREAKAYEPSINEKELKRDISEAIQQLGG